MNSLARMISTVTIWLMVTGIIITGMVMSYDVAGVVVLALILGIGAAIATEKIWSAGEAGETAKTPRQQEKLKRRSPVDLLLERLDDAELDDLRARLVGERDGEAASLEDLLAEQERRVRRR
jgi:hypothetical protein